MSALTDLILGRKSASKSPSAAGKAAEDIAAEKIAQMSDSLRSARTPDASGKPGFSLSKLILQKKPAPSTTEVTAKSSRDVNANAIANEAPSPKSGRNGLLVGLLTPRKSTPQTPSPIIGSTAESASVKPRASLADLILKRPPPIATVRSLTAKANAQPFVLIDKGTAFAALLILLSGTIGTLLAYRVAASSMARDTAALLQSTADTKATGVRYAFQPLQDTAFALAASLEPPGAVSNFEELAQAAMARQKGLVAVGWLPMAGKSESAPPTVAPLKLSRVEFAPQLKLADKNSSALASTDFAANSAWAGALRAARESATGQLVYTSLGTGDALVFQAVRTRTLRQCLRAIWLCPLRCKPCLPRVCNRAKRRRWRRAFRRL